MILKHYFQSELTNSWCLK